MTIMDCKDLMINDFVHVTRGYDKHLTIEKIKGIIADKDEPYPVTIFTGETVSLDGIDPIPLTEEILVKNGFTYEEDTFLPDTGYWSLSDEDGLLYFTINSFGVKGSGEVAFGYQDIALNYVHQLQHLLRLCGLKKEIEL